MKPIDPSGVFESYLEPFTIFPQLSARVLHVLTRLPAEVQNDFLSDPHFRVGLDDCPPGKGRTVLMPELGPAGSSRCVVLKPKLDSTRENFAHYIIAHEFAHAHLHNGGWGDITDVEEAADALAASWGFNHVAGWW